MITEQSIRNFLGVKLARRGGSGRRAEHLALPVDSQLQQMPTDATPWSCACLCDGYLWIYKMGKSSIMLRSCSRSHAVVAVEKRLAKVE